MEDEFVNSILKNWVVLSIGTKGSGKTYLVLKFLKFAIEKDLYDQYILVLPMFRMEENDSYSFIDPKKNNIYVYDAYHEVISSELIQFQTKNIKHKLKTFYLIDDASGEQVFRIDDSLRHLITSIRHFNTCLWMCVHSASGILSPFIRQQTDILFLSKITNYKLLKNIYEEFLSLMDGYIGHEGHENFVKSVIELHKENFQVIYMNIRTGSIDYKVAEWNFNNLSEVNIEDGE